MPYGADSDADAAPFKPYLLDGVARAVKLLPAMDAIDILTEEHSKIGALLDKMDELVRRGRSGEALDQRFLADAAEFFVVYVDGLHHAKEMVVFRALKSRLPKDDAVVLNRLMDDHARGAEMAAELGAVVSSFTSGLARRDDLLDALTQYVSHQRTHSAYEQTELFPMARRVIEPSGMDSITRRLEFTENLRRPLSDELAALLEGRR